MVAKVICMASAKGGSGKTVLTATFCRFLAELGKRILMIDTDGATNGLTLLYLQEVMNYYREVKLEEHKLYGIYQIESYNSPADIVELKNGVHLIPATYEFTNTDIIDADDFFAFLKMTLSSYRQSYDYIFLDAQAGADEYSRIAMSRDISDEVVIISEYDPMSAAGVERLKNLFPKDLTYERTWILLNKMLPDFVKSFSDFLEIARYLTPVPWNEQVVLAYARRRLALDFEMGNEFTLTIIKTLNSLLGKEISQELTLWSQEKSKENKVDFNFLYSINDNRHNMVVVNPTITVVSRAN